MRAAITFVIVLAAGFFLTWVLSGGSIVPEGPDEKLVRLYGELAANQIKMTLRDGNAKTENVIFHPMAGSGPHGHSYACGYVRRSTDAYGRPERFIYYFDLEKAVLFRSFDRGQIEQLADICNAAPFPLAMFNTADGKFSLRTK